MESAADVLQGRLLRYLAGFNMIKEVSRINGQLLI